MFYAIAFCQAAIGRMKQCGPAASGVDFLSPVHHGLFAKKKNTGLLGVNILHLNVTQALCNRGASLKLKSISLLQNIV